MFDHKKRVVKISNICDIFITTLTYDNVYELRTHAIVV